MNIMSEIKPMDMRVVREYYLRPEVLDMLFDMCAGREIVPVYYSRKFGKRPASVMFLGDIEHMVRDGATSFHCSLEHWSNPLLLANIKLISVTPDTSQALMSWLKLSALQNIKLMVVTFETFQVLISWLNANAW